MFLFRLTVAVALLLGLSNSASAQQGVRLLNAPCTADTNAPVTEPKTGRTFLLDYPCDLKAGEAVTLILNLHGGGSSGTWQRRYFPAFDYKERYKLVVASPYAPIRRWTEADDAYLQNIVTSIVEQLGTRNVRAFWLAGHSQGGATSRRLICTDFFKARIDGFVSLSGGRIGGAPQRDPGAGRPAQANATAPRTPPTPAGSNTATAPGEPTCDFSHIYETGEHEVLGLPTTSTVAQKFHCGPRVRRDDIVDTQAGHVHDGGSQNPGTRQWGLLARPGKAEVFVYPNCAGSRVVADIRRLDKGHTEGLEPKITEEIVKLIVAAPGGRLQRP